MTTPDLKPCPACGSPAGWRRRRSVSAVCDNGECEMVGPRNDYDGAKWNALPRRGTGKEMEELRAALADWRGSFPDEWLTTPGGERRWRVRRAIDAVLAAAGDDEAWLRAALTTKEAASAEIGSLRATVEQLTKERDELRAEVARYIRDRVCDCDEMCQGMRLAKERDEARGQRDNYIDLYAKTAEDRDVVGAENGKLRQQITALKELVREFAREGGDGK